MGRENFPVVKEGDALSARHVNRLSAVARRVSSMMPGSHMSGFDGSVNSPNAPHIQRLMIVTASRGSSDLESSQSVSSGSSSSSSSSSSEAGVGWACEAGNYQVRPLFWTGSAWETNNLEGPYCLDASKFGDSLEIDDVVTCWWDVNRAMFLPVGVSRSVLVGYPATGLYIDTDHAGTDESWPHPLIQVQPLPDQSAEVLVLDARALSPGFLVNNNLQARLVYTRDVDNETTGITDPMPSWIQGTAISVPLRPTIRCRLAEAMDCGETAKIKGPSSETEIGTVVDLLLVPEEYPINTPVWVFWEGEWNGTPGTDTDPLLVLPKTELLQIRCPGSECA